MIEIGLMYLLAVVALVAGVYTFDNLLIGTEHDKRWWRRVVIGSLVMAIPMTILANSDIESALNVFWRIVRP